MVVEAVVVVVVVEGAGEEGLLSVLAGGASQRLDTARKWACSEAHTCQ